MKIAGNNKLHVPNVVSFTQNITKAARITVAAVVATTRLFANFALNRARHCHFFVIVEKNKH